MKAIQDAHPEDTEFAGETGAEAVRQLLSLIDLHQEIRALEDELREGDFGCIPS